MSTTTAPTTEQQKQATGSFGNGRYSQLMSEIFEDSQVLLKLNEEQADKLARAVGRDFGAYMSTVKVEAKVSRSINKDGKVTLSEAAKMKGVTATIALEAMRVIQFMNEAGKFHILSRKTEWKLSSQFEEMIASLK